LLCTSSLVDVDLLPIIAVQVVLVGKCIEEAVRRIRFTFFFLVTNGLFFFVLFLVLSRIFILLFFLECSLAIVEIFLQFFLKYGVWVFLHTPDWTPLSVIVLTSVVSVFTLVSSFIATSLVVSLLLTATATAPTGIVGSGCALVSVPFHVLPFGSGTGTFP